MWVNRAGACGGADDARGTAALEAAAQAAARASGHRNRLQEAKAKAAVKKALADEEAAKAYASFVASLGVEQDAAAAPPARGRGRGRGRARGRAALARGIGRLKSSAGAPGATTLAAVFGGDSDSDDAATGDAAAERRAHAPAGSAAASGVPRPAPRSNEGAGRRRIGDSLIEALPAADSRRIGNQAAPQGSQLWEGRDAAQTTNLFVGNLAPSVTEEALASRFSRFGRLASVKIMWPRDNEARLSATNNGFVCFERRRDAERARDALEGEDVDGSGWPLKLSWARMPPGSATPGVRRRSHSLAEPDSRWGDAAEGAMRDLRVQPPADAALRRRIDAVAQYVAADGAAAEDALRARLRSTAAAGFSFLEASCEDQAAVYYRWRVASLAFGDTLHRWHGGPFRLSCKGRRWLPPERSGDLRERGRSRSPSPPAGERGRRWRARRRSRSRSSSRSGSPDATKRPRLDSAGGSSRELSESEREKFQRLLGGASMSRSSVREAMVFALTHAHAAGEVSTLLGRSFTDDTGGTVPPPAAVARLYVISDIVANAAASVPFAASYRSHLQAQLPDVFEQLGRCLRAAAATGRLTAGRLEDRCLRVLRAWAAADAYPPLFLTGLEATLLRPAGALGAAEHDAGGPAEGDAGGDGGLDASELAKQCRLAGVSTRGTPRLLLARLNAVMSFFEQRRGALVGAEAEDAPAQGEPAAAALPAAMPPARSAASDAPPRPPASRAGGWATVARDEAAGAQGDSDSDVDGVPLDAARNDDGDDDEDDDDIDGVPL